MNFWGVWLKGFLDRKIGEARVFSPQILEKIERKNKKFCSISISPNWRENRKENKKFCSFTF